MTIEQVILNNFLISLEQDSHIFEGRLTVDEYINLRSAIVSAIKALGAERPRGEWIYHKEWEFDGECAFECSKCGMGVDVDYNFCPNCGADMRKGE